jgi:hypothetical protein
VGADTAIDGLGSGTAKRFGTPPERRSGCRDIVNQEEGSPFGSWARRKAPSGQLESTGPGMAGLAVEAAAPQKPN